MDVRGVPPVHLLGKLELAGRSAKEFTYDFRKETIPLGREPSNDVQIPLTTVSRHHARIFYELGDFFLEDLGSTHGTFLNGARLDAREKKLLREGDSISIVTFHVTFKTTTTHMLSKRPGEKTEALARRMVQEVLASLGDQTVDPTSLRIMNGADEGRRYEIEENQAEVVLGRSPECDIVLDDQNASRRHCLIKRTWNGFAAQDLGSKNGVLVNGVRIDRPHPVKDGDEIQVGGVKLIFIDPASRILDQMGLPQETGDVDGSRNETPIGTPAPAPETSVEVDDVEPEGAGDVEAEEESENEDGEADEEEASESDVDADAMGEDEESAVEADDLASGEPAPPVPNLPKKGIGPEVAILVIGIGVLLAAAAVVVWLWL